MKLQTVYNKVSAVYETDETFDPATISGLVSIDRRAVVLHNERLARCGMQPVITRIAWSGILDFVQEGPIAVPAVFDGAWAWLEKQYTDKIESTDPTAQAPPELLSPTNFASFELWRKYVIGKSTLLGPELNEKVGQFPGFYYFENQDNPLMAPANERDPEEHYNFVYELGISTARNPIPPAVPFVRVRSRVMVEHGWVYPEPSCIPRECVHEIRCGLYELPEHGCEPKGHV